MAHKVNPNITFEVFIHKVDSDLFMQDDQKFDTLNDVTQLMKGHLQDYSVSGVNKDVQISYHLTSIYDLTIY